jgi:F0F1-type ATP synthase assembly protein I
VPDPQQPKPFDAGPGLIAVGSEFTAFALVGILLDYLLSTMPWFTIGMTGLGAAAAVMLTIRLLKKEAASQRQPKP